MSDTKSKHPILVLCGTLAALTGTIAGLLGILEVAEKRHWITASPLPSAQTIAQIPSSAITQIENPPTQEELPPPSTSSSVPARFDEETPPSQPVSVATRDELLAPSLDDGPHKAASAPSRRPAGCASAHGAFSMARPGDWHSDPTFGGFRIMSDPRAGISVFNPHEIDPRSRAVGKINLLSDVGFQRATRNVWLAIPGSPFYFCVDSVGAAFGHHGPVPRAG